MTSKSLNFTKVALERLVLPKKGKRAYYYDERERGLIIDVRSSGSKSFYLYKKINGRPERIFLGQFPDLSIENARKMAASRKGEIAQGDNPQEERRKVRGEMTLGEFFKIYLERHSKPHKKSWKFDEREINKYLSHWFNRRLSDITRNEIHKLHSKIGIDNGKTQANRILERIRNMYNKAIEWGWEGENPATRIQKFKETSRDRFLNAEELPRFFAALEEESEDIRDYFLTALFTGARKTNVLTMRWKDIDFHLNTWRIPDTKNGEPQTLPLSQHALEILTRRKKKAKSEWVFSGTGEAGHFVDPKKAWQRVVKRGEFDDLRIHDLRRTLGSWLAASGVSLPIIGKTLGHKSSQSTQIYARLNLDPVRESLQKATSVIDGYRGKKRG
jgi:integrase